MKNIISVFYRYRPIWKLDLSVIIGIGRYGKIHIVRTLISLPAQTAHAKFRLPACRDFKHTLQLSGHFKSALCRKKETKIVKITHSAGAKMTKSRKAPNWHVVWRKNSSQYLLLQFIFEICMYFFTILDYISFDFIFTSTVVSSFVLDLFILNWNQFHPQGSHPHRQFVQDWF